MDLWAVLETFCRSPFVAPGASESNQNNLKVHWQPGLKGHSKCLTLIWREYSRNMFERSHLFPCKKFHPAISCLYLEGHHHHQPDRAIDPMQQSTTATTAHILILTCTGKELELKDRKEPSLAIATLKSALQINVFFWWTLLDQVTFDTAKRKDLPKILVVSSYHMSSIQITLVHPPKPSRLICAGSLGIKGISFQSGRSGDFTSHCSQLLSL